MNIIISFSMVFCFFLVFRGAHSAQHERVRARHVRAHEKSDREAPTVLPPAGHRQDSSVCWSSAADARRAASSAGEAVREGQLFGLVHACIDHSY